MISEGFERYSRQILFPNINQSGQLKLKDSKVAVVGLGALGTVIANHLTRSGVGYLKIIDRDFVEMSNLQRQMLYDENDALENKPKAIAAYEKLTKINSSIIIKPYVTDIHSWNAEEILSNVDIIVDATDNFQIRYIMNDVSVKYKIPWIYGGAVRSRGMFAVFHGHGGPCYRCLFPTPPVVRGDTCDTVGVISPITSIVASYQATETIKLIVGDKQHSNSNLEQFDIWLNDDMSMELTNSKNDQCTACVHGKFEFLSSTSSHSEDYSTLCGRNTVQISPKIESTIDLEQMEKTLAQIGKVERNPFLLKFHVNTITIVLFKNGRVLVQGTEDITEAKSLYHKYIGN
ncbi:ThiF family adenylyltransferase [Bacillus sp. Marseille-P3661]|uniref:ThiF family adenylyltransferase n=1 Tax=Bacillus sp. Marseille-P3661 TaxID=1936234 RepID=UPI000C814E29|nr:ThiF family adenylyltransferase [Bacillus sp. Marseille-P3661]